MTNPCPVLIVTRRGKHTQDVAARLQDSQCGLPAGFNVLIVSQMSCCAFVSRLSYPSSASLHLMIPKTSAFLAIGTRLRSFSWAIPEGFVIRVSLSPVVLSLYPRLRLSLGLGFRWRAVQLSPLSAFVSWDALIAVFVFTPTCFSIRIRLVSGAFALPLPCGLHLSVELIRVCLIPKNLSSAKHSPFVLFCALKCNPCGHIGLRECAGVRFYAQTRADGSDCHRGQIQG